MNRTFMRDADLEAIARLGEKALSEIPPELAQHCEGLVIRAAEYAEDEVLDDLGIDHPLDLLGLYQGVGLPWKSVNDPGGDQDMVWLYRQPILDYCRETGEDLEHVVQHVLIHEIGHHFGFSDDDMDHIETEA